MRKLRKEVRVGSLTIGGNHPIAVQSMLNVPVRDIAGNVAQAKRLESGRLPDYSGHGPHAAGRGGGHCNQGGSFHPAGSGYPF